MIASDLFDFPDSLPFRKYFRPEAKPWLWVGCIAQALSEFDFDSGDSLRDFPPGLLVKGPVYIHPSVRLPHTGTIEGPAYFGPGTELRPNVFIRGNVIAGAGCVLGNACEFKNCLLLDDVRAPHFNYVGDSILGNGAHLGAGVICANLRFDQTNVTVTLEEGEREETGYRKLGAILGDHAEVGCNSVLQPGTILGRRAVIGNLAFGGTLEPDTMAFGTVPIRKVRRDD